MLITLLSLLTKNLEGFASGIRETIKRRLSTSNQKVRKPLASIQKQLGLFSQERFGSLMASDAGSLGDFFSLMERVIEVIVWGIFFLLISVILGVLIVGGVFIAISDNPILLRIFAGIFSSIVALLFFFLAREFYEGAKIGW